MRGPGERAAATVKNWRLLRKLRSCSQRGHRPRRRHPRPRNNPANAIATTVSTRALTAGVAVGMAGVLNLAGAFISIKVAPTVGKSVVHTAW
jgi:hypothetical protein